MGLGVKSAKDALLESYMVFISKLDIAYVFSREKLEDIFTLQTV